MRRQQRNQGQQSRFFYELLALVPNLLRLPTMPLPFSDQPAAPERSPLPRTASMTTIPPAGFAWLMLGISVSLMLCGSVTFFIGFMLMPWVLGLVMVCYVAGIVSTVSMLGRSILCYAMAPPSRRKDIPEVSTKPRRKETGKQSLMGTLFQHGNLCEEKNKIETENWNMGWIIEQTLEFLGNLLLSSVDVNTYGDEEDSDESKEDNSMDENGNPTGLHHHRYHHRSPVRHTYSSHSLGMNEALKKGGLWLKEANNARGEGNIYMHVYIVGSRQMPVQ
ncbi:hypothetical protein Golax_010665 [Gossypium laxum]|uniref:Uncharacterized protein n=1 Tax=Gossypium laxum TaxID=34288 RepID=A0A7J8ZIM5_9ROSI|nr:hypothetical protein [Gossypium laxum]